MQEALRVSAHTHCGPVDTEAPHSEGGSSSENQWGFEGEVSGSSGGRRR